MGGEGGLKIKRGVFPSLFSEHFRRPFAAHIFLEAFFNLYFKHIL
jgi:hypothetical protein